MRFQTKTLVILFLLYLAGCANWGSIHRDLEVDKGKGALIDIKQRAILVSKNTSTTGNKTIEKTIVCSEPSPDAVSAYAAQFAAEADLPEVVTARLVAAFQESASFTGLRTQSIQLLRDSMYRLCEAYMSGALDEAEYDILMRRYQKYMVALLAIEQLTGTVRVPPVTINTQGSAEAARSLSQMRAEIKEIDTAIAALEEKKKADGVTDEQKRDFDKQIADLNKDKEAITKGIDKAQGLAATGSATATVITSGLPSQRSEQHIQAVSDVVEKIVTNIINTDDTGQLCWAYLSKSDVTQTALTRACERYIDNLNEGTELRNDALKEKLKNIKESELDAGAKAKKLEEILDELPTPGFELYGLKPPSGMEK